MPTMTIVILSQKKFVKIVSDITNSFVKHVALWDTLHVLLFSLLCILGKYIIKPSSRIFMYKENTAFCRNGVYYMAV